MPAFVSPMYYRGFPVSVLWLLLMVRALDAYLHLMKIVPDPYLADVPQCSHYCRHDGYVVGAIGGRGGVV